MEFISSVTTFDCPHFKEQHTLTQLKAPCVKSGLGGWGDEAKKKKLKRILIFTFWLAGQI